MRPEELKRRLTEAFDLPDEVTLDVPRVLLLGRLRVEVENHRGLVGYEPNLVVLGVARGQLHVHGADLVIHEVSAEAVRITGRIDSLHFEG